MKVDDIEALAFAFGEDIQPPDRKPRGPKRKAWQPNLGPIGTRVLLDKRSKYILLHGERGSLKTGILLHKVAMHSYEYLNTLSLLTSITRSSATEGGMWEKFNSLTLPEWFDGIGMDFTPPKQDDQKNRYVFVGNQYGGWSKVVLRSMPFGVNIQSRIKGMEPSLFAFDELTEAESSDYFKKPIQQLGRRPGIPVQQFVAACNPAETGKEHWVYKEFFDKPFDKETGKTDPDYGVYYIPITENVFWTREQVADYQKKLMVEAKDDPSAIDRLIHGKWEAKRTGDGLFKEHFMPAIHVRGDARKGQGLRPIKGFPIILGYDLGQVYSSVTFLQLIPTQDKPVWIVFDEIDYLGKKILYRTLAREISARMQFWSRTMGYQFQFMHITDESAVNQFRPGGEGSYDAWEFEKEFNKISERPVKMMGCPKGKGSVAARVRMLQGKLYQEDIFISAMCRNTVNMLMFLEPEKDDPNHPRRSKWIHKFDSLSYPIFKMEMGGDRKYLRPSKVAPSLIHCGM